MAEKLSFSQRAGSWLLNAIGRSVILMMLALPYGPRMHLAGWFFARVLGPLSGARKRIKQNLAYVWPELPASEVEKLCIAVPDNIGRCLLEQYSAREFNERVSKLAPIGPGIAALDEARVNNRPIIVVSGHFGNCHAARSLIMQRGHKIGALYRDMSNPYFNPHYVEALAAIASPMFGRTRRGMAEMVKFLRQGNTVAILPDQYYSSGMIVNFFGKPAPTAPSVAELALKYDALIVPVYSRRLKDGISFEVLIEEPIPHSDVKTMTQAINDGLEAQIRKSPEQWLWSHKRWKPERAHLDKRKDMKLDMSV
ncbi:lysophospholipid acyltransferase family protein [Cognatishimia sp.]|uniref:lysophospholipid acyltransferase family protein n=1 Tax=Cognatishimia sp. TaxID=2211648 RepID=UPI003518773A|nr:lysophospholipid acyltransferase family protein [Cognatishimia sp.]